MLAAKITEAFVSTQKYVYCICYADFRIRQWSLDGPCNTGTLRIPKGLLGISLNRFAGNVSLIVGLFAESCGPSTYAHLGYATYRHVDFD